MSWVGILLTSAARLRDWRLLGGRAISSLCWIGSWTRLVGGAQGKGPLPKVPFDVEATDVYAIYQFNVLDGIECTREIKLASQGWYSV